MSNLEYIHSSVPTDALAVPVVAATLSFFLDANLDNRPNSRRNPLSGDIRHNLAAQPMAAVIT